MAQVLTRLATCTEAGLCILYRMDSIGTTAVKSGKRINGAAVDKPFSTLGRNALFVSNTF